MKHFNTNEISCNCGCNLVIPNARLYLMIEEAREIAGIPFIVSSWTRCKIHNKDVGGSKSSSHLIGKAIDIQFKDSRQLFTIVSSLVKAGFTRIGINYEKKFLHCDVDMDKIDRVLFTY